MRWISEKIKVKKGEKNQMRGGALILIWQRCVTEFLDAAHKWTKIINKTSADSERRNTESLRLSLFASVIIIIII